MRTRCVATAVVTVLVGAMMSEQSNAGEMKPWAWRGQTLTEFAPGKTNGLEWQIINDGVMGGLSKGNVSVSEDGIMKFSGTLSLENNGGFSMVRSTPTSFDLSNDLGILLRVKGDGREYQVRFDSDATWQGRRVSFSGKFQTTPGKWIQVKVPFDSFEGSWRGRDLPDKTLNPADIRSVAILLGDKKAGAFDVEIDYIRTYGKGQGNYPASSSSSKSKESDAPRSLIATMVDDGRFTKLKAALDAAKLTTFFQWDNKLTVFAPTDEAFANLPDGALEDLLKPENKDKLVAVLSHHVHPGALNLEDAIKSGAVNTVEGTPLTVSSTGSNVRIGTASLIDDGIECSDGIIHVIDKVLLPSG